MDFSLTEDHIALQEAVRRFCDGEYPAHQRGNAEDATLAAQRRQGLAGLGVTGLIIDPAYGGNGRGHDGRHDEASCNGDNGGSDDNSGDGRDTGSNTNGDGGDSNVSGSGNNGGSSSNNGGSNCGDSGSNGGSNASSNGNGNSGSDHSNSSRSGNNSDNSSSNGDSNASNNGNGNGNGGSNHSDSSRGNSNNGNNSSTTANSGNGNNSSAAANSSSDSGNRSSTPANNNDGNDNDPTADSGYGAVETMLVAQQLGRALGGAGWLASGLPAAALIDALGSAAQKAAWLPAAARGEKVLALAVSETSARYDLARLAASATRTASGWRIDGVKTLVFDGATADAFVVAARTSDALGASGIPGVPDTSDISGTPDGREDRDDGVHRGDKSDGHRGDKFDDKFSDKCANKSGDRCGNNGDDNQRLSLFVIDAKRAGVGVRALRTLDAREAARVTFDGVAVGAADLLGHVDQAYAPLDAALDRVNAALCAEAVGALEALLELTAEHLKTRTQFGAPLAKCQALQHRIADMLIMVEQGKSMACAAAMAVDESASARRCRQHGHDHHGHQRRRHFVSAAKAYIGDAVRTASEWAIQLHGGMGMTDECRAGHYAKRLFVINAIYGDANWHLQRFTAQRLQQEREKAA